MIYPFTSRDTIYGLSVSGQATLYSDTSLVRIIVEDTIGDKFMAFEAYPLIATDSIITFLDDCDETCYLNEFVATSVEIQIIHAQLVFDSIFTSDLTYPEIDSLQYAEKVNKDDLKIANIEQYIESKNWIWIPGHTSLSQMYFSNKSELFGTSYNLLGYDFYSGGTFRNVLMGTPSVDNSDLIEEFDWRNKHDALSETSLYWDGNTDRHNISGEITYENNGWMTKVREQGVCWTCSMFSSVAALESIINLYFNHHIDSTLGLDLSERDAFNCSFLNPYEAGCIECKKGKGINSVLGYFKKDGVVTESCYPIDNPNLDYCDGTFEPDCSDNTLKCDDPDTVLKIDGYLEKSIPNENEVAYLKQNLIDHGPLVVVLDKDVLPEAEIDHAVTFVGFFKHPETNSISWIYKNSWGYDWGEEGYEQRELNLSNDIVKFYVIRTEDEYGIHTIPTDLYSIHNYDKDNDGYWNWGIGSVPPELQTICGLDPIEDWNDNNNRIGGCDDDYNGLPVKPDIKVLMGAEMQPQTVISRDEFVVYTVANTYVPEEFQFTIQNTGNAQLNLEPQGLINGKVSLSNENNFSVIDYPDRAVCWAEDNNTTSFDLLFTYTLAEEAITKVTIEIDEPDIEDFVFYLVYANCNDPGTTMEVDDTYVLWDEDMIFTTSILLTNRTELEITSAIALPPNARIIVEPQSKLFLNGGAIGSACDELWNGIFVLGDPEAPQTDVDQGVVEIKNGGVIQMARVGVQNLNLNQTPSGGIINCKEAVFKDNIIGVKMYPYENTNFNGNPIPNFSSFSLCDFVFTDFIYGYPSETKQGLSLWGVDGLKITGCRFINEGTVDGTPVNNDATGIYSFNAGYWMNEECIDPASNPCPETRLNSFEHLAYGIYAITDRPTKYISIDTASFTDCRTGIYMGAISTPKIIRCVFNSNTENSVFGSSDTTVGIYLEKCNQYFIEENTFTDHRTTSQLSVGIHVLNSAPEYNEIYNNSFTGNYAGIVAAGENRDETGSGLCIKCNDFVSCDYDIYVTADGGSDEDLLGIAYEQGDPLGGTDNTAPAGNTFSKSTSEYNYYNDVECNPIMYTHHELNNTDKQIIPDPYFPYTQITLNQNIETEYTKQEACPSHLNGSGLNTNLEISIVSSELLEINSYEDSLASMTDGGDTDNLNFEVQTSFPDEALFVRQQLLDESPYLSDTVMKSAIAKDDVLPNAMIRDVLVSNPQSAKSQEIVGMLDERIVPMEDYMMDEIMQGNNIYGAKELLEQALGLHKTKKAKSISNLIHFYKSDTSNYYSSNDSIIDLYESFPSFMTHLDLVLFFLEDHDSASASSILTSIPNIFNLTTEEEELLDWYSDLLELQWQFCVNPVSIDTTLLQSLSNFMVDADNLPEIYSRNILINQEEFNYLETVYLPSIFKSTEITSPFTPSGNKKAYLKVFPNPAGRYFIIDYNTEHIPANSGIIRITDLSGRFSREINLIDSRNQIIVPTVGFENGIYIVQIFINKRLVDSIKINIIN